MQTFGTHSGANGLQRLLSGCIILISLNMSVAHSANVDPENPGSILGEAADGFSPDILPQELEDSRQKSENELADIKSQTTISQQKLQELEQAIDALKQDQTNLRDKLNAASTRQKNLDIQIKDSESKLEDLEIDQTRLRGSLKKRNAVLAEVLAALQRLGGNPPPALLVTPEDALSSVRSAILLGAVVPEIREETQQLIKDLQALSDIRQSINQERDTLIVSLENSAREKEQISNLLEEKEDLSKVSLQQLDREQQRVERLTQRSTELEGLVKSLYDEITKLQETARLARLEEEKREQQNAERLALARKLAQKQTKQDDQINLAYAFSKLQEQLELPVEGSMIKTFGDNYASKGQRPSNSTANFTNIGNETFTTPGIIISSQSGAIVKAPTDGWVKFAGPFRSYGKVIIIDVNEGYHIILAGMSDINVTTDQFITKGEPIAVMGEAKLASIDALALASGKPTLYIEFRKNQKPVDSSSWWASIQSSEKGT